MKVVLFGASGMIGGGVLAECLEDPGVESVLSVGRHPLAVTHPKLRELTLPDVFEVGAHRDRLGEFDACLYCIGVSSAGMSEDRYRRITLDLTLEVADVLGSIAPHMTFCFVSGQGTDASGTGRVMWARIKGQAENALQARDFTTYAFRPGFVRPMKGARSRTRIYRVLYAVSSPAFPLLERLFPGSVTTTVRLGRAMIRAALDGYPEPVLETRDINALGRAG